VTNSQNVYEVRPRKDKRGVDLISDALPILATYGTANQTRLPMQSATQSIAAVHMMHSHAFTLTLAT
jgi:hypothetical protein